MVEHDLFGKPASTFPDHAVVPSLDWLTARPIAHRGLHDAALGLDRKYRRRGARGRSPPVMASRSICKLAPTVKPWCIMTPSSVALLRAKIGLIN